MLGNRTWGFLLLIPVRTQRGQSVGRGHRTSRLSRRAAGTYGHRGVQRELIGTFMEFLPASPLGPRGRRIGRRFRNRPAARRKQRSGVVRPQNSGDSVREQGEIVRRNADRFRRYLRLESPFLKQSASPAAHQSAPRDPCLTYTAA